MHNEKTTIFIDGSSGTAGLRIYDRLAQREGAWQAFQRPTLLGAQHLLYPKPQQG